MNDLWNVLASRASLTLDDAAHAALGRYLDLLIEANATMNLTRITDRAAAEVQHVGDALTLLPFLPAGEISVADVGSGGGVPGLPLAIVRPEARFLLIESTKKKAVFLQRTADALGLKNVVVSNERAEDVGRSRRRENYDVATARAVGTLDWLAEWCLPLVKVKGKVLAMKGQRLAEELPDAAHPLRLLGGGFPVVHPVDLPGTEHHVIVEVPKIRTTDRRYPRDATVARGKPMKGGGI